MTQRRSKRKATVKKTRLLEENLKQRKSDAQKRQLRNKSRRELNVFDQEATRLSNLVDSLLTHESESDESVDTLERTVNEIIDEIEILGNLSTASNEISLESEFSKRKNTSTDNNILNEPVEENLIHFPEISWPPRNPSEEPEHFSPHPGYTSSISHINLAITEEENLDSEVFEEEESDPELTDNLTEEILGENFSHLLRTDLRSSKSGNSSNSTPSSVNMDEQGYKSRLRAVKVAERKVMNVKSDFTAQNITELDLDDYKSRLKEIRSYLNVYRDLISELVLDLDTNNPVDGARITALETGQVDLEQEILKNENEVQQKVKELLHSKPLTRAEQEDINLKVKQMEINAEKEKKSTEEKIIS